MSAPAANAKPRVVPSLFDGRRVRFTLILSAIFGVMLGGAYWKEPGFFVMFLRAVALGMSALLVFGIFERWPKRLPRQLPRWILQVVAVGVSIPFLAAFICAFYAAPNRMAGYGSLTIVGILFGPWVALGALVRQREAMVRHQALAFDLERSELERQALDARLRLLQTQVAPHFLFNTLANVQALVDAGSPQASTVLRSLIAYLRAAVPKLNEPATTLGQELELVRAYLELMHMRMPDRLQFTLFADEDALNLRCPPMTLLTLVENAVRHGIDPSEEGGRIEIHVQRRGERCVVRVTDTGAGLRQSGNGLGTGLSTLRERLQLTFGGDVQLRVSAGQPRGVSAEVDMPAREGSA